MAWVEEWKVQDIKEKLGEDKKNLEHITNSKFGGGKNFLVICDIFSFIYDIYKSIPKRLFINFDNSLISYQVHVLKMPLLCIR